MSTITDLVGGDGRYRWIVESFESSLGPQFPSDSFKYSSHNLPGYLPIIARTGHSYSAPSLTLIEWTMSGSEFTIALSYADPRFLGPKRGTLAVVKMGRPGWSEVDYLPIYYGQVQDIHRTGFRNWSLVLRGLLNALTQTNDSDTGHLFSDLGDSGLSTTLDGDRVVGDPIVTFDATICKRADSGAEYVVEINTADGTSILSATASTATTLNGTITERLGTVDLGGSDGDEVRAGRLIADHPVSIVRRILLSTGAGTNGALDNLPADWGMGFPQDLIDGTDMASTETQVAPGEVFHVIAFESIEDPLSWMQSWLNPAGMFLTEKAGLITVRPVLNPYLDFIDTYVIYDRDLVEVLDYSTFNPNQTVEYRRSTYVHPDGTVDTVVEDVLSLPKRNALLRRLEYADTNVLDWQQDTNLRAGFWALRLTEIIKVKVVGLKTAFAAPGSRVYFYSKYISDRYGLVGVPWTLISVQPDWFSQTVELTAVFVPVSSTD